ncbi:MAG TPA: hypothetical protein VN901_07080 [Candidatus Acidoferrales bacterium]|nr:hypothetical protein [Candidatus Acidoferrales bacterium]
MKSPGNILASSIVAVATIGWLSSGAVAGSGCVNFRPSPGRRPAKTGYQEKAN